jgi:L-rhamnose mutarotase
MSSLINNPVEKSPPDELVTKRVGSLIRVRPEFEERYIILHKHTFPGVLAQIRRANIRDYSIFLRDGILFSYYEYVGNDFTRDMAGIGEDETTREWWKLTDPMQEPLQTRKEGEWWATMEEVFFAESRHNEPVAAVRFGSVINVSEENLPAYRNHFHGIPADIKEIMKLYHVNKIAAYFKDGSVYYYYKVTGTDARRTLAQFFLDPQVEEFSNQIKSLEKKVASAGETEWQAAMREVFHTD